MAPRSFPTRFARRLRLSAETEEAAHALLGPRHPLTRAISLQRTLAIQLLVTVAVVALGLGGVLSRGTGALLVLGAATLVGLALLVSSLLARELVRDRTHELIAAGFDADGLDVLGRERRRLASPRERERLARLLERYVRDAETWDRMWPSFRPVADVRCLLLVAAEARETARILRSERVNVRGVAAVARFLMDGSQSALFKGDVELLRRELLRLCWLLSPGEHSPPVQAHRAA
jgi:hypothetical protein